MNDRQANDATREKNPKDQREPAVQTSERTVSEFAEGASGVKDATAKATDQAMRAGLEMFQRNAETVQHTLECGAKLASRMTKRSANQFGRAFGLSGEGGEEAAQRSSRNIEAVVQSGTTLTDMMQHFFDEWADISRARIDRAFDRMSALSQCHTPQDFAAFQSEVLRDNIETFLVFARKMGEHSTRLADEAKRRVGSLGEGRQADKNELR
jgi:hypothetical protein